MYNCVYIYYIYIYIPGDTHNAQLGEHYKKKPNVPRATKWGNLQPSRTFLWRTFPLMFFCVLTFFFHLITLMWNPVLCMCVQVDSMPCYILVHSLWSYGAVLYLTVIRLWFTILHTCFLPSSSSSSCVCVCVCVCERACMRACMRERERLLQYKTCA